jgi:hypothetical protein
MTAYWRRVHARALSDAQKATGLDSAERSALRIIVSLLGVVVIWWATKGGTTSDLIFRILATIAVLGIFPIVYFIKFLAIPPKMDLEANTTISQLNLKLDDREKRMMICRVLGQFIESGQEILVSCTYIGKPVPREVTDRWEQQVHKFIKDNLDPIYFSRFRNWSDIPKEEFGFPSQPHEELWQGMRARLARLHQYINELRVPTQ